MTAAPPASRRRNVPALAAVLLFAALIPPPLRAHAPLEEQIAALDARIASDPASGELRLKRGELHRALGDWSAALVDFAAARRLDPDLSVPDLGTGRVLLASGHPGAAIEALDRFLSRRPGDAEGLLERARALEATGRHLEAARDFTRAIGAATEDRPPRPEHYLERARALAAAGSRHLEEAIRGLEEGMERLGPAASMRIEAVELRRRAGRADRTVGKASPAKGPRLAGSAAGRSRGLLAETPSIDLVAGPEVVAVEHGTPMRWLANASDPGTGSAWTLEAFDDSAWGSGVYGVGYETGSGAQNLIRTSVPAGSLSVFTRARFDVPQPGAITSVFLGADYDDGFVAWINGVEVHRSPQIPAGAPAWNTTASLHESSNGLAPDYGALVDVSAAALPALHAGTNVLAIGVWNAPLPSTDLVLVPRLSFNRPVALSRGPYLQQTTPNSVIVRWRTAAPSDSAVRYGTDPNDLSGISGDAASVTEHSVLVDKLTSSTRYYYSIGTAAGAIEGGDADHFFETAPPAGRAGPGRIWVIGDSGTANANARAVRDAYLAFTGARHTDLWLMLGDNAYQDGTDAEFQAAVFDMYPQILRNAALWPTFGNHDGHTSDAATQTGAYFDSFTLPTRGEAGGEPSGTEAYYAFDWGNVHFICLESYETDRSKTGAMARWLRQDLAAPRPAWTIAFFHHPPYSKGSHDSDREIELVEMRQNFLPILEEGGVDLVLTGHSHSYERSFLLDGHYGLSTTLAPSMVLDAGPGRVESGGAYVKAGAPATPHAGAVYVVAGSSGATSGGLLNHPAMYLSLNLLGSLVLDLDGNRLDATFLGATGASLDRFTLMKGGRPPSADAGPDALIECASPSGTPATLDGSASSDADSTAGTNDDIVSWEWFEDLGGASPVALGTGAVLSVSLSPGPHAMTLRVTDAAGNVSTDETVVTIRDTTPPGLALSLDPAVLWPPNHRMVPVHATVRAEDACGPAGVVLVSVLAKEMDDMRGAGPGISSGAVVNAESGSPDFDFELRAERGGSGAGRLYTVTYLATDAAGNATQAAATVTVPHDASGGARR